METLAAIQYTIAATLVFVFVCLWITDQIGISFDEDNIPDWVSWTFIVWLALSLIAIYSITLVRVWA